MGCSAEIGKRYEKAVYRKWVDTNVKKWVDTLDGISYKQKQSANGPLLI